VCRVIWRDFEIAKGDVWLALRAPRIVMRE
jgi:hypothetical protein